MPDSTRHPPRPVAALGLGSSTFGREIDQAAAFALLDHAVARGLTFLDTAALYSAGAAERIIGAWLADRRPTPREIFLATKIYPPFTATAMTAALQASLARLDAECVDLLYLHKWDAAAATAEAVQTLDTFVRTGLVRALGASNFTAEQLAAVWNLQRSLGVAQFTFLQNNHNLAVREADDAVRLFCAQNAIQVVTYSPLGAGFLSGKHRASVQPGTRFDVSPGHRDIYFTPLGWQRLDALERVARRLGVPQTLLAQAWVMHHVGIDRVIVGGRNPAHIEQALAARAFDMPEAFAELSAT
ncbi:MAG: aldo/keto reductase [Opitutaceae bacterium]|nr:aldo/keto reductase [Opitutaceae bacterium]